MIVLYGNLEKYFWFYFWSSLVSFPWNKEEKFEDEALDNTVTA